MKTTIDIADGVLARAKRLAARRGTTLRAVVEQALRETLEKEEPAKAAPKLETHVFTGKGLQPGLDWEDFGRLRDLGYEGRGG